MRLNDAYLRVPRSLDSYQSVPRNHQVSTQVPVASKLQAPTGRGVEADAEATLDKLTVVSDVSDEDRAGELEQVRETEDSLLQSGQDGDVEEGAKSPRSTSIPTKPSMAPYSTWPATSCHLFSEHQRLATKLIMTTAHSKPGSTSTRRHTLSVSRLTSS